MDDQVPTCFFCAPDEARIVGKIDDFYLICGLGPIIEGYVILASKSHIPSMLDLSDAALEKLQRDLPKVRSFVGGSYDRPIMLEHGRIPACTGYDSREHDKHCYHAHLLIFPSPVDILEDMNALGFRTEVYKTWEEARSRIPQEREYLFFGDADGGLHFARVHGRCPRQFLRHLVARVLGKPDEADWKKHPNWEVVKDGVARYGSQPAGQKLTG